MTFYDGGTVLGTGTLSPGGNGSQATLTTSALANGSHSITVVYGGDGTFAGSSSSPLTQTVGDNGAFVWTGHDSNDPNDWNDPADWLVDGVTATRAPGENDDVIFGGPDGTSADCATDGDVSVHSITIDSNYNGTLTLNAALDTCVMDIEGGAINQTNALGAADITVAGNFNWINGALNVGKDVANLVLNGTAYIGGVNVNLQTGDNLVLSDVGVYFGSAGGSLTLNNGAGITLNDKALFSWDGTANIVGTGVFLNNGGNLRVGNGGTVSCGLAYDNEGGSMKVQSGTLVLTGAGPNGWANPGASLMQNSGNIFLGVDNGQGATLQVKNGLAMNGGGLFTAAGFTSNITGGNLTITGGVVLIGAKMGSGELDCTGSVTMSGGVYSASIDLTAKKFSIWEAQSFTFPANNTAALTIGSLNIPAVLPKQDFAILETPANNGISGDFKGGKTVAIGATGQSYRTALDGNKQKYNATP